MKDFEIMFSFNGKLYTATIQKIPGRPIKYLASIHRPHDIKIDHPISFVAPRQAEMLGWVNIHEYPTLAGIIATAITSYADEHGLNLFKS